MVRNVRPAGVEEHEQTGIGVPQELGRSCHLHGRNPGRGHRVTNPRLDDGRALPSSGANRCVIPWYRPREGNEARREGRQEVGVPYRMRDGVLKRLIGKWPGTIADGRRV
jgi:hypothetical protein